MQCRKDINTKCQEVTKNLDFSAQNQKLEWNYYSNCYPILPYSEKFKGIAIKEEVLECKLTEHENNLK